MGYVSDIYVGIPTEKKQMLEDLTFIVRNEYTGGELTHFLDNGYIEKGSLVGRGLFDQEWEQDGITVYHGSELTWYQQFECVEKIEAVVTALADNKEDAFIICVGESDGVLHSKIGNPLKFLKITVDTELSPNHEVEINSIFHRATTDSKVIEFLKDNNIHLFI
jgi:hypothetical protein|tara:strand:+ start:571 stop:1062 length:492 start_codon:yes stop_codon:yes gene_type:complete